jgi:hypothetical protein
MLNDGATIDGNASIDEQRVTDMLQVITERRAIIEQAKGMIMFVYGISADDAFALLRRQSQEHNVKLNLIADQVAKDLVELSRATRLLEQPTSDDLIGTAHRRISHSAARQRNGESKTGTPMADIGP